MSQAVQPPGLARLGESVKGGIAGFGAGGQAPLVAASGASGFAAQAYSRPFDTEFFPVYNRGSPMWLELVRVLLPGASLRSSPGHPGLRIEFGKQFLYKSLRGFRVAGKGRFSQWVRRTTR